MISEIFNLKNKNIIVTGAAGLLGQMHIEAIIAFNGIPILIDIDKIKLKTVVDKCKESFKVSLDGYVVDISDECQIRNNAQVLNKKYGNIDGLINNAANNPAVEAADKKSFSRLENFSIENWNEDIAVGLTGAFLCSKYYGHLISKNPEGGSIINISSDLALIGPDQRLYLDKTISEPDAQPVKPVSYSVVKAGLLGLTKYLATYWPDKNVRCNAICPAGVENGQDIEFLVEIASRIPLNRLARPDEYQGTLIWMLSDASSFLNGAIVPVDGGRTSW